MERLQNAPREGIRAHQWRQLHAVLALTRERNAFYRRKWGDARCESWEDFGQLPLTTKGELVADQEAHPPFGTNLAAPLEAFIRVHQTSGTSGRPLRWLDTAASWAWWRRCWSAVYEAAGVTSADRLFFAFSFGPFIGFWSAFEAAQNAGALAITGGGQTTEERIHQLCELQARSAWSWTRDPCAWRFSPANRGRRSPPPASAFRTSWASKSSTTRG